MKEDVSLSQFADQLDSIMPEILRDFASRKHFSDMVKTEVSMPQILIMENLVKNTAVKMTDIAKMLSVTTAAATGIVDRMVKKSYLRRNFDIDDRRIIKVELTSKGQELIKKLINERRKIVMKVFSQISQDDRKNYLRILNKVRDIVAEL